MRSTCGPREGPFRLGPIDVSVGWGERISIAGPNGGGKTTLLDGLLGRVPLIAGTRRVGPAVVFGEIGQARAPLRRREPLLGSFCAAAGMREREARTLLAKFDLYATTSSGRPGASRPVSGRAPSSRVQAARGAGCLVLDEPTNHLDLPAVEELERALGAFDGTLILVTHDRRFLEQVGVTRVVELSPTAPASRSAQSSSTSSRPTLSRSRPSGTRSPSQR